MGREYRTRCINEVLRTWYVGHYSQSSLQARKATDYRRIAPTMVIVHGQQIQEFLDYFSATPMHFCRAAANYARFSFHAQVSLADQWYNAGNRFARSLWLAVLPVGIALYVRDIGVDVRRRVLRHL
jgi:hypothetical protein